MVTSAMGEDESNIRLKHTIISLEDSRWNKLLNLKFDMPLCPYENIVLVIKEMFDRTFGSEKVLICVYKEIDCLNFIT